MSSTRILRKSYDLILKNTKIRNKNLVPEVYLHLLDTTCPWYYRKEIPELENDPFWSVFWPGGQVLSRFILDNKEVVKCKNVLDFGCGCGALGIAAKKVGAKSVVCNDIDQLAMAAVELNFKLNKLDPPFLLTDDLLKPSSLSKLEKTSIFMGDMFYDEVMAKKILAWCKRSCQSKNTIYIGDPGRWGLDFIRDSITKVEEYEIIDEDCDEYRTAAVFQFQSN